MRGGLKSSLTRYYSQGDTWDNRKPVFLISSESKRLCVLCADRGGQENSPEDARPDWKTTGKSKELQETSWGCSTYFSFISFKMAYVKIYHRYCQISSCDLPSNMALFILRSTHSFQSTVSRCCMAGGAGQLQYDSVQEDPAWPGWSRGEGGYGRISGQQAACAHPRDSCCQGNRVNWSQYLHRLITQKWKFYRWIAKNINDLIDFLYEQKKKHWDISKYPFFYVPQKDRKSHKFGTRKTKMTEF